MIRLLLLGFLAFALSSCAVEQTKPITRPVVAPKNNQKPSPIQSVSAARYVSMDVVPTAAEVNPLMAISTFRFSRNVYTVGDAINQVIRNTGYTLSPKLSDTAKLTLKKPLPITNRKLGPLTIKTTLEVLMGQGTFNFVQDTVAREVNFVLKPSFEKPKLSTHRPLSAKPVPSNF